MKRILRKPEVFGPKGRTGLSETSGWRMERAGEFPRRVQISEQAVGWFEDEVDAWLDSRQRGIPAPPVNVITK
jgi:prophage regulatory protein